RLGVSEVELLARAQGFIDQKVMRRFSAVLHHRRAGFKANAMVVWKVPAERAEAVGQIMASFPQVSHCYQRPVYPDWPYSHFTMVHAVTKERCEGIARKISEKAGIADYMMLFSVREWKKTRVKYFV
ncbi:MAG: Lrp/AsnC family transcriptional regulator, partial [Chloroflexi bacterium]|nr:Lrp/AsnC family transcriptional regulator [Chloroflexota bacterium]